MRSGERRNAQLVAASLLALLVACSRPSDERPPTQPPAAAKPPPSPSPAPAAVELPKPPPPIERAALLSAVARTADAYAAGRGYPNDVAQLAGREFQVKLPFGCHGPPADTAALRYAWDAQAHKIKLTAAPETWTGVPWIRELVGSEKTEAIEGFWLPRPWILSPDCPAQPPMAVSTASPQTVALVQTFEAGGSRLLRRNSRPYEVTRKLQKDESPPNDGYRLVIAGRIADGAAEPPIRCHSSGPDERPTCFVRVELDRVAFESGAGDTIADWTSSGPD